MTKKTYLMMAALVLVLSQVGSTGMPAYADTSARAVSEMPIHTTARASLIQDTITTIPSPWIIAFPEEEVIEGFNWEAGVTVTLTILTGEQLLFQATSVADYPDWDPSTTYVRFDVKALGYSDLERGDHIVMTDERTTRDLLVPVLYVDVINLETNTISGSGEPYSEITIVGIQEEPVVVTVQGNGGWTANFAELPPGARGSAIQYDEDGDETRVNFYIPNVELSPGYSQNAAPGSVVAYTHVLTNTGTTIDTFALDATSSQGWPVSLLGVDGTLNLPLQLNAGLTVTFLISLSVPTAAINGTVDTTVITATSQTSPTLSAVAVDTTTVKNVTWYVYLPLVLKRWPPIPDVPVLNPISNPDGDGNYTVSWNAAYLASTYTLQEDDNAAFSSPTTQYAGPGTFWPASGKPAGTYYYRVKATNGWGDSGWSNIQSVSVLPPSGPTPGFWESTTGDEFYVTADRAYVDDFAIYISVSGCGDYKITHLPLEPIVHNQFSFGGSFYASGTFNSATTASGTDGLSNFYIPGCGYISGGPWSWNATWQHSSQSTYMPADVVGTEAVEGVAATGESYMVAPIK